MRRFSLYKRNGIFYCRFWNPETKTYTSAKSTGEYSKKAAMAVVYGWEQYGLPEENSNTVSELLNPARSVM